MFPLPPPEVLSNVAKSNLLYIRDLWFHRLEISTELVFWGLLLELPELGYDMYAIAWRLFDKFKNHISFPEKHSADWVRVLAFAGWILIVVGVRGEFLRSAKVNEADGNIQAFNGWLLAKTAKEAGDAAQSAKNARDEADAATQASGKAQGKADAVGQQADRLKRELTSEEAKLNAVDAKRAELEKSLVNLAVCNAPRVIPFWSIGNTKTAADPLKPFARQAIIEFVPDAETRRAALNIAGALDKAGWKISRLVPVDGIDDGVEVQHFVATSPPVSTSEIGSWDSLWQA